MDDYVGAVLLLSSLSMSYGSMLMTILAIGDLMMSKMHLTVLQCIVLSQFYYIKILRTYEESVHDLVQS